MAPSVSLSLYREVTRTAMAMGYPVLAQPARCVPGITGHRVPLDALVAQLRLMEQHSGDEAIGLRTGRLLGPAAFGVAGYLAMAGPTLIDALPRVIGYQRLVADGVSLRFANDGCCIAFAFEYAGARPARLLTDLLMAGVRCFGAWLLGSEPPLASVQLSYASPADTSAHEAVFGRVPRFDAPRDGFSLSRTWLEAPLRTEEASLVPVLEAQASRLLAMFREDDFVAGLRAWIGDALPAGEVTITGVAAQLHVTPRTLQRRLQVRGLTFHRLLQGVRMDLAHRYLADPSLSLQEIAGRLGYQEHSSFCHAYRQWTGRTPSAARHAFVAPATTALPAPGGR